MSCRCLSLPGLLVFLMTLVALLVFSGGMLVAGGSDLHKDQGKERENERLHESNKQLKRNEDDVRNERQQEGENCQQRATCEDIAKETEGERDNASQLANNLNKTGDKLNHACRSASEQGLEIKVFAQVFFWS